MTAAEKLALINQRKGYIAFYEKQAEELDKIEDCGGASVARGNALRISKLLEDLLQRPTAEIDPDAIRE